MRAWNVLPRTLGIGLIGLWMGCAGGPPALKTLKLAGPCVDDMECKSRFCNNGYCHDRESFGAYGYACTPSKDSRPDLICPGNYLCVDGRCRSCLSDDDCTAYFGVGKCIPAQGSTGPQGYECIPNTTRRRGGFACDKDEQCWTGFCDRGTCTAKMELIVDNFTYGMACVPWRVPEVFETLDHVKACTGYLCLEQRCRSCVSDEECHRAGVENAKCMALTKLSGKVCATPEMIANQRLNGPEYFPEDDAGVEPHGAP